jgi:hypothetical protein
MAKRRRKDTVSPEEAREELWKLVEANVCERCGEPIQRDSRVLCANCTLDTFFEDEDPI